MDRFTVFKCDDPQEFIEFRHEYPMPNPSVVLNFPAKGMR